MSGNGKMSQKPVEEISLELPPTDAITHIPDQKQTPKFFEDTVDYHVFESSDEYPSSGPSSGPSAEDTLSEDKPS